MTPSPDPALFRDWQKQRVASLWGMPLWNHDELLERLRLCRVYPAFESKLGMVLEDLSNNRHPVFSDIALKAAFQVLSCHFEDKRNSDSDDASPSKSSQGNLEDSNTQASSDYDLSSTVSHQVPESESSAQAHPARVTMSLSDALGLLIADTVRRCGPDAREVFHSILENPNHGLYQLEAKIRSLTLAALEKTVDEFEIEHSFPDSWSSIISLQPVKAKALVASDKWQVAFKSEFVAKCALRRMEDLSLSQMKESALRFNSIPAATSLAGYCFEMLAHRLLRSAQHEFSFYEMALSDNNPPNFTCSADTCSRPPSGTLPRGMEGRLVRYNRTSLPMCLEDSNSGDYFVPEPRSNSFFDAFFYEYAGGSATLYILQMMSASDHRGSKEGFVSVRDIVYFLETHQHRRRGDELSPQSKRQKLSIDKHVTVKYILVSPGGADGPFRKDLSWRMPDGWGEVQSKLKIHGECFILPIRIDALRV